MEAKVWGFILAFILSILVVAVASIAINFYNATPGNIQKDKQGNLAFVGLMLAISLITLLVSFGCIIKIEFF
jgi:hypothetical protein